MRDFLFSVQTDSWRTAGCRYNAARRLKRREFISTVSLAFFSALTVALAFLQRVYAAQPGSQIDNYLTALSACLGIFLLAISLIEWGAANGAKTDSLHRNAEVLNAHSRKIAQTIAELGAGGQVTWGAVDKLRTEYEAIKESCSHNHEPLDDRLFLAQKRMAKEFLVNGKPSVCAFEAGWIEVRHWWSSLRSFSLYWAIVVGLVAATPWFNK
ncbi:MAG: SLATT domain-containing protein [Pseudomonas sp.]